MKPFTVAILADTHIRTEPHDPQAGYPSDALHNTRARHAVQIARQRTPAFTVHLGDVTHTLPGLPTHEAAQIQARLILDDLEGPLFVAPGNHDVGDKLDSHATAPRTGDQGREVFRRHWGPTWRSWDHECCHFVILDTAVLNTGSDAERGQREWFEADLRGHARIFVFMHYPAFVHRADEPAHYDNVGEPARAWFLELLRQHRIEAVFAGHVHNVFLARRGATRLYTLPSTAFVRPEYAELFAVAPADENGRNDEPKLGLAMLHVDERGHRVEFVRSALGDDVWSRPPGRSPLGVWLRGGWARAVDLPCGDLDEFGCKRARNDYPLLALLDLGIRRVRIPLSDLGDPDVRARAADLKAFGIELLAFSAGIPGPRELALLEANAALVSLWEVILPSERLAGSLAGLGEVSVPIAISRIDIEPLGEGYFSHFPEQGFSPDEDSSETAAELHSAITHLVFRVPSGEPIASAVATAERAAARAGKLAICHVQTPRGDERRIGDDDLAIARTAVEALGAAESCSGGHVYLDTFEDKDRGYYPRHGLIDRRGNPREAACALRRALVQEKR